MKIRYWLAALMTCVLFSACNELADVETPQDRDAEASDISAALMPAPCEPYALDCGGGGGGGGGGGTPAPAPTGANLRVTLTLTKVVVRDTEDLLPSWPLKPTDEFYTTGGMIFGDATTGVGPMRMFMSPVFGARKGSTYSPNQKVVDVVIPPNRTLMFQFEAMDEDIGKDSEKVAVALASYNLIESIADVKLKLPGEFKIATKALSLIGLLASTDSDDKLGGGSFELGTFQQNQVRTITKMQRVERNKTEWYSEWDYDVTYTINVTPTDASLTPMSY